MTRRLNVSDAEVCRRFDAGERVHCADEETLAAAVSALTSSGVAGIVWTTVLHDAACSPDVCRCEPEFYIQRGTIDVMRDGLDKQAQWARGSLN